MSETAPRGARMTMGRVSSWKMVEKMFEVMYTPNPSNQRGRRMGRRRWSRGFSSSWTCDLRWIVRPGTRSVGRDMTHRVQLKLTERLDEG